MDFTPHARARELLELDPLRHIVGLKMLRRVGAAADVTLREDESGWAALIAFPPGAFEYDAQNYAGASRIAVLEGSSDTLLLDLLDGLDGVDLILKTQNPSVLLRARERFGAQPVAAFVSFTSANAGSRRVAGVPNGCTTSTALTPALTEIFERNGYAEAELARYFASGARWFALERAGALVAACFVFQNFGRVWEIAGVHTETNERRRGFAKNVVAAALDHLLAADLLPRYQTIADNEGSMALARSVGLVEFLRIEHLKLNSRAASPNR